MSRHSTDDFRQSRQRANRLCARRRGAPGSPAPAGPRAMATGAESCSGGRTGGESLAPYPALDAGAAVASRGHRALEIGAVDPVVGRHLLAHDDRHRLVVRPVILLPRVALQPVRPPYRSALPRLCRCERTLSQGWRLARGSCGSAACTVSGAPFSSLRYGNCVPPPSSTSER